MVTACTRYGSDRAREKIWVPYLQGQCACDADTIVIGHSSGAVACMRLLESTQLRGAVLVSACHTDLGDAGERAAGYYSRPWQVTQALFLTSIFVTFALDIIVALRSAAPLNRMLHQSCT